MLPEQTFLQRSASELNILKEAAETHYHVILARMLAAACRETIRLREEILAQGRRQAEGQIPDGPPSPPGWASKMIDERTFLQQTLSELEHIEAAVAPRHRGVLVDVLRSARQEAKMLLREERQARAWPLSAQQPILGIR